MVGGVPQRSPRAEAVAARIDRVVGSFARHWLLVFNLLVGLYLTLPVAAPTLMETGHTSAGQLIYLIFRPQCHQLPERSFFLFGESATYSLEELERSGGLPGLGLSERGRFPGNEDLGYKIAFCERDLATWGAILLTGLLFGISGRRWPRLPIWGYLLFLVPMAVDGVSQLIGWRESNWILRSISGFLFGSASVWLAYPYVEAAMSDVRKTQSRVA